MNQTIEGLRDKFSKLKDAFVVKGLKINLGEIMVMVSRYSHMMA